MGELTLYPHGRGEHNGRKTTRQRHAGLIPTGVGNTSCRRRVCAARRAHPHGRGEHVGFGASPAGGLGSSPRAWGTPTATPTTSMSAGLIPTGVGNTPAMNRAAVLTGAHPHGRGEHLQCQPGLHTLFGSSPRAWGTHRAQCEGDSVAGLIPTGVGNTSAISTRWCG